VTASVSDVNWARAPALSIARLPAQPAQAPAGGFRGRDVLNRPDFLEQAASQVQASVRGMLQGRDGDFRFAVLDARRFDMTVVETHEWGLTDTVAAMPRKPDAVINGQFLASAVGVGTEGQVLREGQLINADAQSARYYVAQTWRGADVGDYRVGRGDPRAQEPSARAAFGGLGPLLLGGAPVTSLTPWARSVYDRAASTGKGAVAIHRGRGLILLVVQANATFVATNVLRLAELRDLLQRLGFADAVFNDGSDSEALYAGGAWLLAPGWVKDEAMDFAIGFVDRSRSRRLATLVIDGTGTADGAAFANGAARPLVTHYAPQNLASDLAALPSLAPIAGAFRAGVLEAHRATTQSQADLIGGLIEQAGRGGHWADVLYVSSHAWRHGELWYYRDDDHSAPKLSIANPWTATFRPVWRTTPRWLIIAGCAVLALRYSRGLALDPIERGHLMDWHREIHGPAAQVPGLTPPKRTLMAVYHPGWAWYERIFRASPGLRGVLGYWYRSPGSGIDEAIVADFAARLSRGEPLLEAWEIANRRGWLQADAAWAAMVRHGCEADTLATLEEPGLPPVTGTFRYYDQFQTGREMEPAYLAANRLTATTSVGTVAVPHNADYDALALEELARLATAPTPANFLAYSDGVGP
jgi:hypothetical protein